MPFGKHTLHALLLASALTLPYGGALAADKVLRMVPTADLRILDPLATTASITQDYAYNVYDTLFGVDAKGKVHPQMVDKFQGSADSKVWTFTLRDQLAFHDGKPVTSADVIASIKRWSQRDGLGQKMMADMASMEAKSDKTFVMTFKEPFASVAEVLARPAAYPAFIMPKSVADTPVDQQITSTVGSGPFIFKADEYRPGEKSVYLKNTKYVPRKDAASGTAGGKVVEVDRIEWVTISDPQTQANALANGEVDLLAWVPSEQYLPLKKNPAIEFASDDKTGMPFLHLNRLVPPFNNTKIAQAALMVVNQEALMRAQVVHKELYQTDVSIYPVGSQYFSAKTSYFTGKPQIEKARALLKEAGYKDEPVVVLNPASNAVLNKYPQVLGALLKQAGFNVKVESMDWATLVSRRALKSPATQGGWNAFITTWSAAHNTNPLFFAPLTGNGEKGWFGWVSDEPLEKLKSDFLGASTPEMRNELATRIQERVFDAASMAPLGQFKYLTAYRKGVKMHVSSPVQVLWGISKD